MKQGARFFVLALFSLSICGYDLRTECVDGIQTDVSSFTFEGSGPEDYYPNICTNELGVKSIWAAAKLYCTEEEIQAGSKLLGGYCEQYGMVTLTPYENVLPELTDQFIGSLLVVNFEDINASKIWNESILISRAFYTAGARTTATFSIEMDTHHRFGYAMYAFWGGIMLIGTLHNIFKQKVRSRPGAGNTDLEGSSPSTGPHRHPSAIYRFISPISKVVQTHFIVPAAFGTHHQRLFYGAAIPTRIEAVVLVAFYVLTLIFCCVSYDSFWPNIYYTPAMQICRYVADRTGIIAYSLLPILWMFSGRNNVFLWMTGWSFASFNVLHRHIARVVTILANVHSISYTVMEINYKDLAESWSEQYWYMGGLATISMSLIIPLSSPWIRKKSYELFLLFHIAFSIIVIVSLFFHTNIFDGEYNGYLWPLVAIWGFDRVARMGRLAYCNTHLKLSGGAIGTTTTATYSQDTGIIRLEITPKSRLLKPGPGQHFFIYQPLKWKGWENHPFTLAAWEDTQSIEDTTPTSVQQPKKAPQTFTSKEIQVTSPVSSSASSESGSPSLSQHTQQAAPTSTGEHRLVFLIRPFDGWTKRLREECLKTGGSVLCPKIFIEGPYGERSPLHTYENVLLVAGGSGITACLPYLQDHLARTRTGGTGTFTRDITLVWTTKQSAMISDVAARELKASIGREDIHFSFHATSRNESPRTVSVASADLAKELELSVDNGDKTNSDEFIISYGRPSISAIINSIVDEVHTAGGRGGRIAVLTCGPAGLADECRATVHMALKKGKHVDYVEESFGW